MQSALRQKRLQQLGIESWLPRYQLPSAKPGLVARVALQSQVLSEPENFNKPQGNAGRSAASLWQDSAANTKTPIVPAKSSEPVVSNIQTDVSDLTVQRVVEQTDEPQSLPTVRQSISDDFELHIMDCAGHLLLVDEGHRSLQQAQLLGSLLYALSQLLDTSLSAQVVPFSAQQVRQSAGIKPQDMLEGLLQRRLMEVSTPRILLLGDLPKQLLGQRFSSDSVFQVNTHSTAAMLQEPSLKAEVWRDLQAFISS